MHIKILTFISALILSVLSTFGIKDSLPNDTTKTLVYKFNMKEMIGPALWRQTKQAFSEANEAKADYVIIHINTYGGLVDAADSIRTKILNSNIPVFAFIDNNAASAGALISIACDSIYMRKGANIGAATVVNQTGEAMPDKYQSYMRSTMRSTAEAHGMDTIISGTDTIIKWRRDPLIAEAMVDPRTYIEGIIDTGKVITFTTDEAIKNGYCEGTAENIDEVLKLANVKNYEIKEYILSPLEKTISFLINPYLQGILIMIIIGGIYFELQTPGIGFPILAAASAAVIYFAPLYLEGLAQHWEILLFIVGIVLIALELFVVPGFGVTGISGITLVIAGLTLSMVDNIDFEYNPNISKQILKALSVVLTSTLLSIISSIYFGKKLLSSNRFSFLVLKASQQASSGFVGVDLKPKEYVGSTGIATTILRPSGKVEIDGENFDAMAETGYIEKGENITVIKYQSGQLVVKKC